MLNEKNFFISDVVVFIASLKYNEKKERET